jgi:excisionase family DNA binding protein
MIERDEQAELTSEGERNEPLAGEKPGWWRKERAVSFLEITARSLQRYVKEGSIRSETKVIKGVTVALYNEEDIRNFKHQRDNHPPSPRSPTVMPSQKPAETALTRTSSEQAIMPLDQTVAINERMIAVLERMGSPTPSSSVPVENKLVLTLDEASALTSLSTSYLRQDIKNGKLKAKIMGRGYRIKRADLDAYVKKL